MLEKNFHEKIKQQIIVPEDKVAAAIKLGIKKGELPRQHKKYFGVKMFLAAALLFLAVGIFMPKGIFADIKNLFVFNDDKAAQKLAAAQKLQGLGLKQTHDGVTITIESAYYDAGRVGVLYTVSGKGLVVKQGDSIANIGSLGGNQNASFGKGLKKVRNGLFSDEIMYYLAEKDLPENFKLPISFTDVAGHKGKWQFEVPVKQLKNEKNKLDKVVLDKDSVQIKMNQVIKGQALTAIDYTITSDADKRLIAENSVDFFKQDGQQILGENGDLIGQEIGRKQGDGKISLYSRTSLTKTLTTDDYIYGEFSYTYQPEFVMGKVSGQYPKTYPIPKTNEKVILLSSKTKNDQLKIRLKHVGDEIPASNFLSSLKSDFFVGVKNYFAEGEAFNQVFKEKDSFYNKEPKSVETIDGKNQVYEITFDLNKTAKFGPNPETGKQLFHADKAYFGFHVHFPEVKTKKVKIPLH